MLPDRETCLELLEAAGCSPQVIDHVQAVERLASRLAQHSPFADGAVVQAGALLHDVGRGFDHGPSHVPKGVAFLEANDVDERVVACVAAHMGAGIDAQQAKAWGWPPERGYQPETIEERIVCHADNLTFGTRYVGLDAVVEKLTQQGLEEVVDRLGDLHAGLVEELGVDPADISASLETPS